MKILPLVLGAVMAVASSSAFAHEPDPVDAAVAVVTLPVVVAGAVVDALFVPPPPPPVVARY
jgi:hypothetical protein